MTEVNNFDIITPQLNFAPNNRSIVLVWLVSRKKDGSTKVKGSNRVRTIKSYHFQSMEHFLEKKDEIITICQTFHCRAYICINPKPLLKTLFTLQEIVMDTIKGTLDNTVPVSLKGVLDSAIMKTSVKNDKLWVIDIDSKDEELVQKITKIVNNSRSGFSPNIICQVPTVNGIHLITHPFDIRDFHTNISSQEAEIKKDALTLLYAYV